MRFLKMKRYVIYYRVSTKSQGQSGLGLSAQERDIDLFLQNYSETPFVVIGTFTENQSGKNADRPVLAEALALARENGAELLVSKLDRLSRRVSQIAALMEDKQLKIRVASMPHADAFQLHVYAALAEQERRFISLRTKQALARSTKPLGGLRPGTAKRNQATKAAADAAAQKVANIVVPMRKAGSTLQQIADALNTAKVPTPRGREWKAMSVRNALTRLDAA
ncbi:recombinase family protein [Fontisubflavum oceani]|uniref:recombinase family protein n=1 Tax=Fontisubflavum oceani TaxID=2978973 RepID=UPI0025B419B1|nr:recombinase family protein [Fontisubflavum oceani]WJY23040.1 recombinase family protein [Fontisubflavum oceani]